MLLINNYLCLIVAKCRPSYAFKSLLWLADSGPLTFYHRFSRSVEAGFWLLQRAVLTIVFSYFQRVEAPEADFEKQELAFSFSVCGPPEVLKFTPYF